MTRTDSLIAFAVMALWGFNFSVIKLGADQINPLLLTTLRFTFAVFPLIFFIPRPSVSFKYLFGYGLCFGGGVSGVYDDDMVLTAPSPSGASPAEASSGGGDGRVVPGGVTPSGPRKTTRMFGSNDSSYAGAVTAADVAAASATASSADTATADRESAAAAAAAAAALALESGDKSISECVPDPDAGIVPPTGHPRARVSGTYTEAAVAAVVAAAAGKGVRSSSASHVSSIGVRRREGTAGGGGGAEWRWTRATIEAALLGKRIF